MDYGSTTASTDWANPLLSSGRPTAKRVDVVTGGAQMDFEPSARFGHSQHTCGQRPLLVEQRLPVFQRRRRPEKVESRALITAELAFGPRAGRRCLAREFVGAKI